MPQRENDADRQHAADEPVQAGIGHEGSLDLAVEDESDEADQDQKDDHPHQKNPGRGKPGEIASGGHGTSRLSSSVEKRASARNQSCAALASGARLPAFASRNRSSRRR